VAVAGLGGSAHCVHAARAQGAHVTAVVRSTRSALAGRLGYDAARPRPRRCVRHVLDVSGSVDAVEGSCGRCAGWTGPGLYGVYGPAADARTQNRLAEFGELSVSGGHLAPGCFPEALSLLGGVDGDLVVTGQHSLDRLPDALGAADRPRLKEIVLP
jgi:hypothetical protein